MEQITRMKQYLVMIEAHCPVPRRFQYRANGSNVGVAISRALKMLRKDLPRKRIQKLVLGAEIIGAVSTN